MVVRLLELASLLVAASVATTPSAAAAPTAGAGRVVAVMSAGDVAGVAAARPVLAPASAGLVVFVPGSLVPFVGVPLAAVVYGLLVVLVS
jgi:hypothetical protein